MLAEFKKFALRGNVVDLAIGVIIGAAFSSTEPFLTGVTSAVKEPRKLVLAVMARLLQRILTPHRYRVGGTDESPALKWAHELA